MTNATTIIPIDTAIPDDLTVIRGNPPEQYINDETYASYAAILRDLGGIDIDMNDWYFPEWGDTEHVGIHISNYVDMITSDCDLRLVKCFLISILADNRSPQAGVIALSQLAMLYAFLGAKGYTVKMLSTAVLTQYSSWLDDQKGLNDQKRNKLESILAKLIPFCRRFGLLRPGEILPPRPRPVKPIKRSVPSPERAVIHTLDCYFVNNEDIRSDVRAAYLLGRFIPERTSEVIHIPLECLTIDDELTIIRIPTKKESPGHMPEMEEYPLLTSGQYESILIQAIRRQQEYAWGNQVYLKDSYKGYLMVSASNPKVLLTADKLNSCLRKICDDLDLRDANGEPVYITYYSLRHAAGVEMLGDADIPRDMTSSMFSHAHPGTIDSYSYPAPADALSAAEEQDNTAATAMQITAGHLRKLQAQGNTWLVGTDAACASDNCDPQYIRCWSGCPHFKPDPDHADDATRLRQLLLSRAKGKPMTAQTQRQLEAVEKYIAKLKER